MSKADLTTKIEEKCKEYKALQLVCDSYKNPVPLEVISPSGLII